MYSNILSVYYCTKVDLVIECIFYSFVQMKKIKRILKKLKNFFQFWKYLLIIILWIQIKKYIFFILNLEIYFFFNFTDFILKFENYSISTLAKI